MRDFCSDLEQDEEAEGEKMTDQFANWPELLEALDKLKRAAAERDLRKMMDLLTDSGKLEPSLSSGDGELPEWTSALLLYGDFDARTRDRQGNTLLHYAAHRNLPVLAHFLTERFGMDPRTGNQYGITAMDEACRHSPELKAYFEKRIGFTAEESFHNPIRRGFFPDPSILRVGSDYYMANSSFVYFPCIPISRSTDLVHWQVIGHAITDPGAAGLSDFAGGYGFWAPDISYYNGRFYVAVTRRSDGPEPWVQVIVSSEQPEGPYSEPVLIHERGIDPSLFTDEDGSHYLLLNRGAKLVPLNENFRQSGPAELLTMGDIRLKPEGPRMLKRNGWYYLYLAEGGTGIQHSVTFFRSRKLRGPYEACPYNPVLHQSDPFAAVQCCGHGQLVDTADGRWYMAYLCSRYPDGENLSFLGRETAISEIVWTESGWPLANGDRKPYSLMKMPLPAPGTKGTSGSSPDPELSDPDRDMRYWYGVRGRSTAVAAGDGTLILMGSDYDVPDRRFRSLILRRQNSFAYDAVCRVEFEKAEDADAGLLLYYDEQSFVKLSLSIRGGICGILALSFCEKPVEEKFIPFDEPKEGLVSAELKVSAKGCGRDLFFRRDPQEEWHPVLNLEAPFLASEGLTKGKRFTGSMVGMYVHGPVNACFRGFHYQNRDES